MFLEVLSGQSVDSLPSICFPTHHHCVASTVSRRSAHTEPERVAGGEARKIVTPWPAFPWQ